MADSEGILYVVPTPVGNLGDITLRSLETLKMVDIIFAEDTRTTGNLLKKYEISTQLRPYHAFNEHKEVEAITHLLQEGKQIALVSDAGTPGISDPGYLLIHNIVQKKLRITCLPGATAFVPALVMSGLPTDKFFFEGFLPHKKGRQTRLKYIVELPCTTIIYESPFRLLKCIEELIEHASADRIACIVREVSKIYEQAVTAPLSELYEAVTSGQIPAKGEIVILLDGKPIEKKTKKACSNAKL